MMKTKWLFGVLGISLLFSCTQIKEAKESIDSYPSIFPDYTFTVIPYNIAPLNFEVKGASSVRADFCLAGNILLTVTGSNEIHIPEEEWKDMLLELKGKELEVSVSVWDADHPEGRKHKTFNVQIAPNAIDEWIAYRLIEPGYEGWSSMGIYQRNLTTFEEKKIATNHRDKKKCINCHSFANYSPQRMMFHIRGKDGGTALFADGKLTKLELDKLEPKKSGTYPMWHPNGRYIVFSSNLTRQSFLSEGEKPLEVYDLESDIIVYDTQNKQVITDPRFIGAASWETFPAWSANGKSLFFCTARPVEMPLKHTELHYNLCKVDFDEDTGKFAQEVDTVYNAEQLGESVSFPRLSPDGKYLLFTSSACATFPIWHREADLKLIRLADMQEIDVSVLNSPEADSYHAWSSDSRWILFSSRRFDGRYTHLFIAWLDDSGKLHKPFLLPQPDIDHYVLRMKSYNIPEFIQGEVSLPQNQLNELFFANN